MHADTKIVKKISKTRMNTQFETMLVIGTLFTKDCVNEITKGHNLIIPDMINNLTSLLLITKDFEFESLLDMDDSHKEFIYGKQHDEELRRRIGCTRLFNLITKKNLL